jgi:hypothetical protein
MKKSANIFVVLLAIAFIVVGVKNAFFTDGDEKWIAYIFMVGGLVGLYVSGYNGLIKGKH